MAATPLTPDVIDVTTGTVTTLGQVTLLKAQGFSDAQITEINARDDDKKRAYIQDLIDTGAIPDIDATKIGDIQTALDLPPSPVAPGTVPTIALPLTAAHKTALADAGITNPIHITAIRAADTPEKKQAYIQSQIDSGAIGVNPTQLAALAPFNVPNLAIGPLLTAAHKTALTDAGISPTQIAVIRTKGTDDEKRTYIQDQINSGNIVVTPTQLAKLAPLNNNPTAPILLPLTSAQNAALTAAGVKSVDIDKIRASTEPEKIIQGLIDNSPNFVPTAAQITVLNAQFPAATPIKERTTLLATQRAILDGAGLSAGQMTMLTQATPVDRNVAIQAIIDEKVISRDAAALTSGFRQELSAEINNLKKLITKIPSDISRSGLTQLDINDLVAAPNDAVRNQQLTQHIADARAARSAYDKGTPDWNNENVKVNALKRLRDNTLDLVKSPSDSEFIWANQKGMATYTADKHMSSDADTALRVKLETQENTEFDDEQKHAILHSGLETKDFDALAAESNDDKREAILDGLIAKKEGPLNKDLKNWIPGPERGKLRAQVENLKALKDMNLSPAMWTVAKGIAPPDPAKLSGPPAGFKQTEAKINKDGSIQVRREKVIQNKYNSFGQQMKRAFGFSNATAGGRVDPKGIKMAKDNSITIPYQPPVTIKTRMAHILVRILTLGKVKMEEAKRPGGNITISKDGAVSVPRAMLDGINSSRHEQKNFAIAAAAAFKRSQTKIGKDPAQYAKMDVGSIEDPFLRKQMVKECARRGIGVTYDSIKDVKVKNKEGQEVPLMEMRQKADSKSETMMGSAKNFAKGFADASIFALTRGIIPDMGIIRGRSGVMEKIFGASKREDGSKVTPGGRI